MSSHLYLFARIVPRKEHFRDARTAIQSILERTRAEPGCHAFRLHEGEEGEALYLYEEFSDEAALQEHYSQPYTRAVFEQYESWLAEPVAITRMRAVP